MSQTLPPQDNARVQRLSSEIFTKHLQQAVAEAREEAPTHEILSASAMAYGNMLEMTVGKKAAVDLIRGLATFIESTDFQKKTEN